jgi:hypothetical protein
MDDLSPSERLDVGWAHLLEGATSGAFTNPFEVRQHMRHIVYGEAAPPPKEDAPKGGRKGAAAMTPDRLAKLTEAHARLQEFREASVAPQ